MLGLDPLGGLVGVLMISAFTIVSLYYVFSQVFDKKLGLIIAFLYSVGFYAILNDREVVPTQVTALWSTWFFYSVWLVLGAKRSGFYLAAFLMAVAWNINLSLMLFFPILILGIFLSKKRVHLATVVKSLALFILVFSPFLLFEIKHGFNMTKAVVTKASATETVVAGSGGDFGRVITLLSKNVANIYGTLDLTLSHVYWLIIALFVFVYLYHKKAFATKTFLILASWLAAPVIFFSLNPIILSEYYLNGLTAFWFLLLALVVRNSRRVGLVVMCLFVVLNIYRYSTLPSNESGYVHRKKLVGFVKEDALTNNYPCVSISYITKPGYDFGWRYFYYLANLHVNSPKSGSPVYTVVFPLRNDIVVDQTFGVIGLIRPDYQKYNPDEVEISCSGENSNLTDPMFGFPS